MRHLHGPNELSRYAGTLPLRGLRAVIYRPYTGSQRRWLTGARMGGSTPPVLQGKGSDIRRVGCFCWRLAGARTQGRLYENEAGELESPPACVERCICIVIRLFLVVFYYHSRVMSAKSK